MNSITRKRAKIFHLTKLTGHQLRIEGKRTVKRSMMKELRAITMKMETKSKASMKKAKIRTVMEKKVKRVKKGKNNTMKVKDKTMETKKDSKNKTMAKMVRTQSMVMNSTDYFAKSCFNK